MNLRMRGEPCGLDSTAGPGDAKPFDTPLPYHADEQRSAPLWQYPRKNER